MLCLAREGRVTAKRQSKLFAFSGEAPKFLDHLRGERGLREASMYHYTHYLNGFAEYLKRVGVNSLTHLSPALLAAYIIDDAPKFAPTGRLCLCGVLRHFFATVIENESLAKI